MSLRAYLVLRQAGFVLDLSLEVRPGEVVALLGRSILLMTGMISRLLSTAR